MNRIVVGSAAAALAAVAAVLTIVLPRQANAPRPDAGAALRTHIAAEGKIEAMPGYDVDVASGELNARLRRILVREGDAVSAGQLVAELENDDAKARVKTAAEELAVARSRLAELKAGARREEIAQASAAQEGAIAEVDEAEAQLRRYRGLRADGMVSQAALDERERAFKAAQARSREAEQRRKLLEAGPRPETVRLYEDQARLAHAGLQHSERVLDKTRVRAPISGTVIKRYLDEGEGITPEIPIVAIADLSKIWVNAEVDETDIGKVEVGDRAVVTSDAHPGRAFEGRVQQIGAFAGPRNVKPSNPAVNLGMKVVQVKVGLADPGPLKLGMTVHVALQPADTKN